MEASRGSARQRHGCSRSSCCPARQQDSHLARLPFETLPMFIIFKDRKPFDLFRVEAVRSKLLLSVVKALLISYYSVKEGAMATNPLMERIEAALIVNQ
ncbi:hypothetical protein ZIOFF_014703 [Zingiber officinale]|uniref:Uncharacterized protein n=1 Tax=Zingiber officinale TaxID=94328 RepID=A0A8J5HTI3_ZINOF|nr:hypothetical protein ZIOFF_014703 [Zingiber officinale]